MAGDRPPLGACDHRDRHARPVRQRPGAGVCGGLRHRVLAAQAGQMGALPDRRRTRGKDIMRFLSSMCFRPIELFFTQNRTSVNLLLMAYCPISQIIFTCDKVSSGSLDLNTTVESANYYLLMVQDS